MGARASANKVAPQDKTRTDSTSKLYNQESADSGNVPGSWTSVAGKIVTDVKGSKRVLIAFVIYRTFMFYLSLVTDWIITIQYLRAGRGAPAWAMLAILVAVHVFYFGATLVQRPSRMPTWKRTGKAMDINRRNRWILGDIKQNYWTTLFINAFILVQLNYACEILFQEYLGPGLDPKFHTEGLSQGTCCGNMDDDDETAEPVTHPRACSKNPLCDCPRGAWQKGDALPYHAYPFQYLNDGYGGQPYTVVLSCLSCLPETLFQAPAMLALQGFLVFTAVDNNWLEYASLVSSLLSAAMGLFGLVEVAMSSTMVWTPLIQFLAYLHLTSEYGMRALAFAVLAAVFGWQCVFFLVVSIVLNLCLTLALDGPFDTDPRVLDEDGTFTEFVDGSRFRLMARQGMMCFLANMAFVSPIYPYRAFGWRHVAKWAVKMGENCGAVVVALWGVNQCPLGQGVASAPGNIKSVSCTALLLMVLTLCVGDAATFSLLLVLRKRFLRAYSLEAWLEVYMELKILHVEQSGLPVVTLAGCTGNVVGTAGF